MSEPLFIQSRNNQRIKKTVTLKDAKHRKQSNLFLVEGLHEIQTAVQYGFPIEEIYCENAVYDQQKDFLNSLRQTKIYLVNSSVSEKISIRQKPAGILGVCKQKQINRLSEIEATDQPLLILESIEKPGNLGAILRSAKAFGFKNIILNNTSIDPYHPNVVRNSRGHSLDMNIYRDEFDVTVKWLENEQYTTYVASPDSKSDLSEIEFPKKTAIILGNEHDGVSEEWKKSANSKLKISMNESVDSLNVSVSASIVLYEVFKQLNNKLC